MTKKQFDVKDITLTGLFTALIFLGTYYFKIPSLLGYTHLGDCFIVLAICMLGTKRGAIASALGAGLADLMGGYTAWVIPTMLIKASMCLVMGLIAYRILENSKYRFWIAAIFGGVVHIILYTVVKIPLFGLAYAISTVLTLSAQTAFGVIAGNLLFSIAGVRLIRAIK